MLTWTFKICIILNETSVLAVAKFYYPNPTQYWSDSVVHRFFPPERKEGFLADSLRWSTAGSWDLFKFQEDLSEFLLWHPLTESKKRRDLPNLNMLVFCMFCTLGGLAAPYLKNNSHSSAHGRHVVKMWNGNILENKKSQILTWDSFPRK